MDEDHIIPRELTKKSFNLNIKKKLSLSSAKKKLVPFLGLLVVLGGLLGGLSAVREIQDIREKAAGKSANNVVVIMLDDLDEPSFNQLLSNNNLPNIKKYLIDRGIRFSNSFVVESICCSSRADFLTGKYSHNSGVFNIWGSEGGSNGLARMGLLTQMLPHWLKSNDYYTAHIGKFMNIYTGYSELVSGWNYWRLIKGYDLRPGMYPVVGASSETIWPEIYQTKYIGDRAIEAIENAKAASKNFFIQIAPHAPHISVNSWVDNMSKRGGLNPDMTYPVLDDNLKDTSEPIVAYNVFDPPGSVILRSHVIKGSQNLGYKIYYNDLKDNNTWDGWKLYESVEDPFADTGDKPIVSFNSFVYPDTGIVRQHIVRGTRNEGYQIYYRDLTNDMRWIPFENDVFNGTGSLPIVALKINNFGGRDIIQYLLRGTLNEGYELYHRARINGDWTSWEKEPEMWDFKSGEGEIMGFNIRDIGDGIIDKQLVRTNPHANEYKIFSLRERSYYVDVQATNVLGESTSTSTEPTNIDDEAEMFTDVNVPISDNVNYPHLMYSSRVYAEGNWMRVNENQTYPLSLYPNGKYPAGMFRLGNDPNGFTSISESYDLPNLNNVSFNKYDCVNQHPWVCNLWPDLNETVVGGKKQIDYLRRTHLDRLESMVSVDVMVGEVLKKLESEGLINNTLIIFTSDNGYLLGEHKLSNKEVPFEESIRVPLIIKPPGGVAAFNNENTVLNIDLAPTIMDYVGVDWELDFYKFDGRSLEPIISGLYKLYPEWRKWFLVEYHYPRIDSYSDVGWNFIYHLPDLLAVRTGNEMENQSDKQLTYVEYGDSPFNSDYSALNPFIELYDAKPEKDPFQVVNLFNNSLKKPADNYANITSLLKNATNLLKECKDSSCRDADSTYLNLLTPSPVAETDTTPTPDIIPTATSTPVVVPPTQAPIPVSNEKPEIRTKSLKPAYEDEEYYDEVVVVDGDIDDELSITVSNLPKGFTLTDCKENIKSNKKEYECKIKGTTSDYVDRRVDVTAFDGKGGSDQRNIKLVIKRSTPFRRFVIRFRSRLEKLLEVN